jgi:hypothetical protein
MGSHLARITTASWGFLVIGFGFVWYRPGHCPTILADDVDSNFALYSQFNDMNTSAAAWQSSINIFVGIFVTLRNELKFTWRLRNTTIILVVTEYIT